MVARGVVRGVARGVVAGEGASGEVAFSSASINTAGDELTVNYADTKSSASVIPMLSQEGAVVADNSTATGAGTSSITYPLDRVVSSTDTILVSVNGNLYNVTNGSTQSRPTNYFEVTKLGQINLVADGAAYYPTIIDTSDLVDWPWTVTAFASTDHSTGGIKMYGAVGDPYVPSNWETYDEAVAAGRFDAFPTKPATGGFIYEDPDGILLSATPVDGGETPCVRRIGNQFVMVYHVSRDTGNDQADQPTYIALATDYPLNFTKQYPAAIDGLAAPFNDYPGDPHRGYVRWGANDGKFPDHPYDYIAYGLFGGTTAYHGAIYGTDTPADPTSWYLVSLLDDSNLTDTYKNGFSAVDVSSSFVLPSGEVAMLRSGSEVGGVGGETYETFLSTNGYTATREARKAITLGTSGAIDDEKARESSTIPYGEAYLTVYSAEDPQQRLALARTVINPHATPTAVESRPNHVKKFFDLKGAGSLPAGLTKVGAGSLSFSANGVGLPWNVDSLQFDDELDFTSIGYAEINYWQNETVSGGFFFNPVLGLGEGSSVQVTDGAYITSFSGTEKVNVRGRSGGVSVVNVNGFSDWEWYGQLDKKHQFGFRWEIDADIFKLNGNGRNTYKQQSLAGATKPVTGHGWVGRTGSSSSAPMIVEQVELRYGVTSGGVAPVVSNAVTTDSSVLTFTLDKGCIGFGTGLTVKIGGSPVSGVWTRTSSTSYTFTAATGTFASGQTITYDVASCDVRSIEDLVAIQDATGASVTNTL